MVYSCLKRLKYHLASFDIVVKEQTTATAITEGTWGFEHTKACFRDEIIPFVKNLKDLFTSFDQYLIDEIQIKDTVIAKLKEKIKSQCVDDKERKAEKEVEELETQNLKLVNKEAATLRELVESERLLSPLNTPLAHACKYTRRIQELLMILQQTCLRITDLGKTLVVVTPKNQNKQVRRTPQITKSEKPSVDSST
nr:hypothetical protein [Tanacetum cinerariifolium]